MRPSRGLISLLFILSSIGFTQTTEDPFSPEEGLRRFQEVTGRAVHFSEPPQNWYQKGQCTWFVRAAREDEPFPVPKGRGNAWQWFDHFQQAGYAVGVSPKPGAIAVWNQQVAGYGHVALVTEVYPDGGFAVWDSNWGLDLKVRARKVSSRENLSGFIYWSNGRQEEELSPAEDKFRLLSIFPVGEIEIEADAFLVILEFSQAINEGTVVGNVVIGPDPLLSLNPQFSLSQDKRRLTVCSDSFCYDMPYVISLSEGLKSQNGESLCRVSDKHPFRLFFALKRARGPQITKGNLIVRREKGLWLVDPESLAEERMFLGIEDNCWLDKLRGFDIWQDEITFATPREGVCVLSKGVLKSIGSGIKPSFSENGDIVFRGESFKDIYLVPRATGRPQKIWQIPTYVGPAILRDETLCAVESSQPLSSKGSKIWQIGLTGGKKLLFEREEVIPWQFEALTGGKRKKNRESNWSIEAMALSPDGQKLVFVKETQYYPGEGSFNVGDLLLLNIGSGYLSLLTDFCRRKDIYYILDNPCFSPDGDKVAFTGFTPYQGDATTYVLNLPKSKDETVAIETIGKGYLLNWAH